MFLNWKLVAKKLWERSRQLEKTVSDLKKTIDNPRRLDLPPERIGVTKSTQIGEKKIYLTENLDEHGHLREILVRVGKYGGEDVMWGLVSRCISLGLQYRVPLSEFTDMLKFQIHHLPKDTSDPDIEVTKSIADYLGKRIEMDFIQED